jgi:hypothetical protein
MSVDISSTKAGAKGSNSTTPGSSSSSSSSSSLYETKTLLCKNKCGYYGNSMQYEGYCSICYRKMKNAARPQQPTGIGSGASSSNLQIFAASPSFDDSTSLLSSSFSFNNTNDQFNNQIWNEQKNLNKFSTKKDTKNSGKSSLKSIFKRPPAASSSATPENPPAYKHSSSSLNLAETVSKVADKAVNLVDQSLNNSLFNLTHSNSSSILNNADTNGSLIEFNNCLNRLLSSTQSSTTTSKNHVLNAAPTSASNTKLNNSYYDNNTVLNEFEDLFKANFPQFYSDLNKQLRQFVEKFLEAFKQQQLQQRTTKDKQSSENTKQSDVVQDFFKKIYKYILTSATIKSHLEKLNAVVSV